MKARMRCKQTRPAKRRHLCMDAATAAAAVRSEGPFAAAYAAAAAADLSLSRFAVCLNS